MIDKAEMEHVNEIAGEAPLMKILPYKKFKVALVVTGSEIVVGEECAGDFFTGEIKSGADIKAGSLLVAKDTKIAIASTGDELIQPGEKISAGKIYNSNICLLASRLIELGFSPKILYNLPDDAEACAEKIFSLRNEIDLLITTGGEPLLRKNLPALIRELKNLSGIEQVTLTTNGVLLKNFARELIAAGLDGINLSLKINCVPLRGVNDGEIFSTPEKIFGELIPLHEKNFSARPREIFSTEKFYRANRIH